MSTLERTHAQLHHVNLSIPAGSLAEEAEFILEVAGFQHALDAKRQMNEMLGSMEPPRHIPDENLLWFVGTNGLELHLTEDPSHHPLASAHIAIEVGTELREVEARLVARGVAPRELLNAPMLRVLACEDPAGNVWEFRGWE